MAVYFGTDLVDIFGGQPISGGGGGGGGLVYETGIFEPASDIARPFIEFSDTHDTLPIFIAMSDSTGTSNTDTNTNMAFVFFDYFKACGSGIPYSSTAMRYAVCLYVYRSTSTTSITYGTVNTSQNSDNPTKSSVNYPRYWVDVDGFYPYANSTSRYWRAGRTYKWYAIWKE